MADNTAVIGALSVILGGDASALDKMLAGAQNSVAGFAKNVTAIAGGIGLEKAIAGAISSITGAIEKGLADADALAKMAESTGVSIDQLSKLKYAGDLANVSLDTLGKGLQSLAMGLASLASGAVTPASQALTAMGISAKNIDGSMKTSGQALDEIAPKFAGYRDGANKAKLAQDLFGAGGETWIPMLNRGSAGLAALGDEAQKFGLVLDGPTQFAVQSLNENLKKMDAIKQGLVMTIVSKLSPAFNQLSAVMLDAKENSTLMTAGADMLVSALKGVISICRDVIFIFQSLSAELGAFWQAIQGGNWMKLGDTIANAFTTMELAGSKTQQTFDALQKGIADIGVAGMVMWGDQVAQVNYMLSVMDKVGKGIKQVEAPIADATTATANALQTFLDKQAKATAAVAANAQTVGLATDAQARLKIEMEAQAIATAKNIPLTEQWKQKIEATADAAASAAQKLAGAQLTQASLAPWELRNQELAKYKTLLDAGAISSATFATASMKIQFPNFTAAKNAALDFGAQIDTLVTSSLNGLASTLASVITGAKSAAAAFQAFGLQVITQLIEMIIKALLFKVIMTAIGFAGGGPVSPADQLAAGTIPLATGGFVTGPGSGTSDSIPAMLSNGEFVVNAEQTKKFAPVLAAINADRLPSFAGGGPVTARVANTSVPSVSPAPFGRAPSAAVTVQMQGAFFDRRTLASLIDGLNGMFANGYKLKLA